MGYIDDDNIRVEIHGDGFSEYGNISVEQYEDVDWIVTTSEDSYHAVHVLMEGIKKYFDYVEANHDD